MATLAVNGVRLGYDVQGQADASVVLVHGSWDARHVWNRIVPLLAGSLRVVAFDRRGHGESTCPPGQGSVHDDVADLAGLIEALDLAPAWVVANSFGASIALRLAAERPGLLRGVAAHEPPLFSLMADDPFGAPQLAPLLARIESVAERIASGDPAGGAEAFIDRVALGPGAWARIPPESRRAIVANAPTFLDEVRDPEQFTFDPSPLAGFDRPVLLTLGETSPPIYAPVIARLAGVLPAARMLTLPGAGHVPHVTHPQAYAEAVLAFTNATAPRTRPPRA